MYDMDKIKGNITLKIDDKSSYISLDGTIKKLNQKQYVYKDENYIISRLEVTQNPKTIVDKNTKNILITIEGNEATSAEYIMEVASEIIDLITTYCGGKAQIIYK